MTCQLHLRRILMASSVIAAGLSSNHAFGQTADNPGFVVEEIFVTARKRAESLQDIPAAVAAYSETTIQSAGIERPSDFINLTSNVQLVETQNAGNAFVVVRGISQARNSEPSVAVIIDGVQQVNSAQFNQELFDIQQIEVLKGPQGGLYGRNAIGGAIVIKTKQPSDVLEGRVQAGVDNGFGYTLRGALSGGLTDNLFFRVSGSRVDTNGYIPNTFLGEDADPYEDTSFRGRLVWQASDNLEIDLRAYVGLLRTQSLYFNITNDVNDTSLPVRVNNRGQNDRDLWGTSLKVTYETDYGTLTSVTAYDSLEEISTGDAFDFLPIEDSFFFDLFGVDFNQSQFTDVTAWSEDIRWTSPADRKFRYIVGAYFVGTDRFISTGNMVDLGNGVFPVFREPSTNPLNPQSTFLADDQNQFAWAVFANTSYSILDNLEIDLSLRYDRDTRENTTLTPPEFLPNIPGFPEAVTGDVRKRSFDDWQPKITLTWQPTPDLTLYGSYARGFRSGGFNQTGVGSVAVANGIVGVSDFFEAETADTFELGAKAALFDGRVQANMAAFTINSQNSYFFVFLAANSTQNLGIVPEARIQGFEFDATAALTDYLRLNVGFGFTDSEIEEFADASRIGNQVPLVSRTTLNVGLQYNQPIGSTDLEVIFRADYRRTGKTWWDVENSTVRNPVSLVDLRGGLTGPNWRVEGFTKNAFDERYNAEFSPGGFVFKGRPRVYGVDVTFDF
ncbi:TonB-dependent receptor [Eilatimonas milleporae]|uniref:Iron complex outermembrane receptor protein n=1 Tax=Eilatimonas milleporae TaxID=911205 RepID=A0A3M0C4T9_9PROT|nr:TonB-dependent receptor [Eilatimonas milleporae]RMB04834.1 iron complex outermembrane receptor protein [Eilatimonas milleporae]